MTDTQAGAKHATQSPKKGPKKKKHLRRLGQTNMPPSASSGSAGHAATATTQPSSGSAGHPAGHAAASTATGRTRQNPCSLKRRGVRPRVNTGLQVCVCLPKPGTRVPAFCNTRLFPRVSRRSRAGPVRSQQRVRAMIGRQQVTGISAARCVFPIPFPCLCIYEFSLSPCPPVQVQFQRKLQDLFEMEPARIWAHYRTCLASGDKKSQGQNCALLAGTFFFGLFCPVVRLVHAPSVSCSIPHRRLQRGGRCTGPL